MRLSRVDVVRACHVERLLLVGLLEDALRAAAWYCHNGAAPRNDHELCPMIKV